MPDSCGRLVVVATPIGNLGDLSPRAAEELSAAETWIVEDTRVSGKLQAHLGVKRPMKVLNDHSTRDRIDELVAVVAAGSSIALITDAGTPVVSDPGSELIDAALNRGLSVCGVPGPSAATLALSLSGFYAQRFAFLGYLPRKPGPMRSTLLPFSDSTLTLVAFESPHRIGKLLAACFEALGDRRYAICRELTKRHEQVWRSTLPAVPDEDVVPRKGEFTVVVEGKRASS
ncbi:MAG: 16S rRNA (cytidine(1402)-2'-O)-methyltransferase [Armatimonadetes bacterium]|nr:16S rRNA (cytidine(1402)-2'-O)-methyltransferase [Armatimonadota bacterium]